MLIIIEGQWKISNCNQGGSLMENVFFFFLGDWLFSGQYLKSDTSTQRLERCYTVMGQLKQWAAQCPIV